MLLEVHERFRRPMIVSETGSEGEQRAPWLRYVAGQVVAAMRRGCELHGLTLYPVVSHPGWLDERHCDNGLWDYADDAGHRPKRHRGTDNESLAAEPGRPRGEPATAELEHAAGRLELGGQQGQPCEDDQPARAGQRNEEQTPEGQSDTQKVHDKSVNDPGGPPGPDTFPHEADPIHWGAAPDLDHVIRIRAAQRGFRRGNSWE